MAAQHRETAGAGALGSGSRTISPERGTQHAHAPLCTPLPTCEQSGLSRPQGHGGVARSWKRGKTVRSGQAEPTVAPSGHPGGRYGGRGPPRKGRAQSPGLAPGLGGGEPRSEGSRSVCNPHTRPVHHPPGAVRPGLQHRPGARPPPHPAPGLHLAHSPRPSPVQVPPSQCGARGSPAWPPRSVSLRNHKQFLRQQQARKGLHSGVRRAEGPGVSPQHRHPLTASGLGTSL